MRIYLPSATANAVCGSRRGDDDHGQIQTYGREDDGRAGSGQGSRRGGQARRWAVDALVALLVGIAQVAGTYAVAVHQSQSITPGGYVLLAAGPAVLVWRRRFLVAVLAAAYVTTLWYATGSW